MFKCDNCGRQTTKGEKTYKVIVSREKSYEQYKTVHDPKTRRSKKEYYTTTGYEPSGELNYCSDCYKSQEDK